MKAAYKLKPKYKEWERRYNLWHNIVRRCYDKRIPDYALYGGRGIKMCDRWHFSMNAFWEDMGLRPSAKHSIDRIDNNGDYEPLNCRWATQKEQNNNYRRNRLITIDGITKNVAQWSDELGIKRSTVSMRLNSYEWSEKRALGLED